MMGRGGGDGSLAGPQSGEGAGCAQASGSVAGSAVRARFPAPRARCLHAEGLQSRGEAASLLALWSVFMHEKAAKNFS